MSFLEVSVSLNKLFFSVGNLDICLAFIVMYTKVLEM